MFLVINEVWNGHNCIIKRFWEYYVHDKPYPYLFGLVLDTFPLPRSHTTFFYFLFIILFDIIHLFYFIFYLWFYSILYIYFIFYLLKKYSEVFRFISSSTTLAIWLTRISFTRNLIYAVYDFTAEIFPFTLFFLYFIREKTSLSEFFNAYFPFFRSALTKFLLVNANFL